MRRTWLKVNKVISVISLITQLHLLSIKYKVKIIVILADMLSYETEPLLKVETRNDSL